MAGSVTGDDNQNAMAGATMPTEMAARRPAINGNTVTPQTGVSAPIVDASKTARSGTPSKASRIPAPAPLALTQAEIRIPGTTRGDTSSIAPETNPSVAANRSGHSKAQRWPH